MQWEKITASELKSLTKQQVCVLPLGSLEKHGPHLPLGTDGLVTHKIALMAAQEEPVAVLPPLFYTFTPLNRKLALSEFSSDLLVS